MLLAHKIYGGALMVNRNFIISVVLLIGAAILFGGMNTGTGKYVSTGNPHNNICADDYKNCVESALSIRTQCLQTTQQFTCEERYSYTVESICKQQLIECIR